MSKTCVGRAVERRSGQVQARWWRSPRYSSTNHRRTVAQLLLIAKIQYTCMFACIGRGTELDGILWEKAKWVPTRARMPETARPLVLQSRQVTMSF